MKITKRKLLGALMFPTGFGVAFGMTVLRVGWQKALVAWIAALVVVGLLVGGTYLLTDDR
jgi:hypothetical protein